MTLHSLRPSRKALAAAVLAAAAAIVAFAGPMDPPPGPIGPTGKTLAEVAPRIAINSVNTPGDAACVFRITQAGSYVLTDNVLGTVGKHGIAISCSGVTLDLNGFIVLGPGAGSLDGITVTVQDQTSITIKNGTVQGWGGDGIDLTSANANNSRVTGVVVSANAGNGLAVGTGCAVHECSVFGNTLAGILTAGGCSVQGCTAYSNLGSGIVIGTGSAVERCTSYFNDSSGISAGNGCTIADCTCRINTRDGILATAACVIRGNTCTSNGLGTGDGAGVHVTGTDCKIDGNACISADRGVDIDTSGNLIIRNTCTGNTNNWAIVSGNAIGPIVTVTTTTSSITGNGASASTLGTADPYANFNY
jgi:hypothetical protein